MHHPPNIKKEETPQVLPRSQASQVSATRSLYFILLNFMRLVKQFLQFSIVYADVIYHIPLFCNGNGFQSPSVPHSFFDFHQGYDHILPSPCLPTLVMFILLYPLPVRSRVHTFIQLLCQILILLLNHSFSLHRTLHQTQSG